MNTIEKFQSLLHELFQFEASDLDFGIYRILNYKREQIERFINNDITRHIENAFTRHKDERLKDIDERFKEAKRKVLETLGANAFTPTGELKPEFTATPVGKDFLHIKEQRDLAQKIDEIKSQVFNDLYSFFSRYYEDGDFIPQYRYSIKSHKYAIPYNGEEVKLYWANAGQYYTKTGILFRDYTFYTDPSKAYKIIFRTVSAKEELGSNKATKARFFVLDDENPIHSTSEKGSPTLQKGNVLTIRFQYRELTEKEVLSYGIEGGSNTSKQEKINQKINDEILKKTKDITLKGFLSKEYKNEKPLLLYHLSRFTAKNTKDYFIHKNLKGFLSEQLDYFIKADVLSIATLENELFLDKHITRAKVVREIGEKIINFLAQIEDFQKRLWEKKKFVLKTDYVITTDRLPEDFYDEVLKNKEQKREWKELGIIGDVIPKKADLKKLKLPVDTRYFSQEFKERLLEKLTLPRQTSSDTPSEKGNSPLVEGCPKGTGCLDDLLDGILIKSENFQALNLLLVKYKNKVQTIYIDPPFNKEHDADYLYNVKYKDSTWISMLENRLLLARDLMNERGSIFVRCDYNGNWLVRPLMNEIFGHYRNEIILSKSAKVTEQINRYHSAHDSLFFYTKTDDYLFQTATKERADPKWRGMHLPGVRWSPIPTEYVKLFSKENLKEKNGKITTRARIILGKEMLPPEGRHWALSQEAMFQLERENKIKLSDSGEPITQESDLQKLTDNWTDWVGYSSIWGFSTENHEKILQRVIFTSSIKESNIILDFFLGSGTTTAVAHKLGRKWIGVEMGEHFWTVVLPRMKKVLAYDKSGISKELKTPRPSDTPLKEGNNSPSLKGCQTKSDGVVYEGGGFFKYQVLEQYEDSLDNIELKENKQAESLFKDDYLLKYFLEFETQESPYLMNIEHLKDPFSYKLKVNLEEIGEPVEMAVDIAETFNYLLGLKVKRVKAQQNRIAKYLFILGEKDGVNTAIVWRNYDNRWSEEDFKKDKEFIINEIKAWVPRVVYVNGQSVLTTNFEGSTVEIHYIEPEFKALMEG